MDEENKIFFLLYSKQGLLFQHCSEGFIIFIIFNLFLYLVSRVKSEYQCNKYVLTLLTIKQSGHCFEVKLLDF